MAQLAIIGNPERSYDVIRILEMLGGVNYSHYRNTFGNCLYFIDCTEGHIVCKSKNDLKRTENGLYKGLEGDYYVPYNQETNPFAVFTVETFLENFPFKIGDMVAIPGYESDVRINNMKWDGYTVNYCYCTDVEEWCTASELIEWNELEEYVPESSENINKTEMIDNTGQDLIDFINGNHGLKYLPIEYTFMELLRRNIIKPSEIIDAHTRVLNDKCDRYKCHYEDSCVSAMQLFNGNFKGDDYESAKKRFLYNTSFSECFPNLIGSELTPEERSEWREFFKTTYGFDPEIE